MNCNFDWDFNKARSNQTKHSIGFEEASSVFHDPMALTIYDQEHSENEDRWITIGISDKGRIIVVCHTFQEETQDCATIRIFSSRKATRKEIKQYGE